MRVRFILVTSALLILIASAAYSPHAGLAAILDRQPAAARPAINATATPTPGLTGTPKTSPNGGRALSPGPLIGLVCVIVTSSAALGFAFSLRRRIDILAGPDPDKQDDD